jgi:hypothetical protein
VKWVRERAELEFDQQGSLLGGFGIVTISRSVSGLIALRKLSCVEQSPASVVITDVA